MVSNFVRCYKSGAAVKREESAGDSSPLSHGSLLPWGRGVVNGIGCYGYRRPFEGSFSMQGGKMGGWSAVTGAEEETTCYASSISFSVFFLFFLCLWSSDFAGRGRVREWLKAARFLSEIRSFFRSFPFVLDTRATLYIGSFFFIFSSFCFRGKCGDGKRYFAFVPNRFRLVSERLWMCHIWKFDSLWDRVSSFSGQFCPARARLGRVPNSRERGRCVTMNKHTTSLSPRVLLYRGTAGASHNVYAKLGELHEQNFVSRNVWGISNARNSKLIK